MSRGPSGRPGDLTDGDLDQFLAAANGELLAHIKAVSDPTSALAAIMARTADNDAGDEPADGAEAGLDAPAAGDGAAPGSYTPPPGFRPPSKHGRATRRARRWRKPGPKSAMRLSARRLLPQWAQVLVALVLIGAGVGLGMELHGSGAQAAGSTTAVGSTITAAGNTAGTVGLPSAACTTIADATVPEICVSQPLGDGDTVFVIHGTGFPRFKPVTVRLDGVGVAPDRPVADLQGTFSYAIDQGQVFFRGPMPPGTYHVVVTAATGQTAQVSFVVNAGAVGVPPPSQPGAR